MIFDIDRWILREACSQAAAWRREIGSDRSLYVSINLSGKSLQRSNLVDTVSWALTSTGADPRDVVLEITESFLVREIDHAARKLEELKGLGVRIALDDFGTGYSSFNYLRRFPIDILKIDKSFVDKVGQGPEESGLARAIIMLSETLKLSTVAEGVEDEEQAMFLTGLGARAAQGYHFARPAAAGVVSGLLAGPESSLKRGTHEAHHSTV